MIGFLLSFLQWVCLIPIIGGSIYLTLCMFAVWRFRTQPQSPPRCSFSQWPPVTILKPVCGLEKNHQANLRSACLQDYPEYQVVLAVQDPDDPVVPSLKEIQKEFGPERVSVVIKNRQAGLNKKINNLLGALSCARYEILVISDSDVRLEPDYLKSIIAPLADPEVGCVCTFYKATCATRWFERMDLLTLNADFIPSVIFAHVSGASTFCLGSSMTFRRQTLKEMGGLESLADFLVEDYEIGRRIRTKGQRVAIVPYFVDIVVDLKDLSQWWNHQVCWDQKTRAAKPIGFFATIVIRSVPFALFFAVSRMGDALGLAILAGALGLRLAAAAVILGWGIRDREGVRNLGLLPVRDVAALGAWFLAFTKRKVVWRGSEFILTRDGRLVAKESPS
jgi:ceramide glucosyltransferase